MHVVVFHCTAWKTWHVWTPLRNAAGTGYVAVSLFFVLSGFILTYVHAGPGAPAIEAREFYENRFARIYPAYAFALLVIALPFARHTVRTDGVSAMLEQAIAVVFLVQAYVPKLALAWNPPAWSLSVEAFFYALFPVVAPRLSRCRRSTLLAIAVACYGICLLLPLAYLHFTPDGPLPATPDSRGFWLGVLRYGPLTRLPEFVIGIIAGRWYLDLGSPRASTRWVMVTIAALGVLGATLALSPALPYPLLHNGLLAPVFALLIVGLAAGGGPLAALLSTRPLVALGEASYSLYVLHLPVLVVWSKLATYLAGDGFFGTAPSTAIFLGLAIGASLLCNRYVERPMRQFTLAVLRGRPSVGDLAH